MFIEHYDDVVVINVMEGGGKSCTFDEVEKREGGKTASQRVNTCWMKGMNPEGG